MIPQKLKLPTAPQSLNNDIAHTGSSAANVNEVENHLDTFTNVDDFLSDTLADAKSSADTIHTATGAVTDGVEAVTDANTTTYVAPPESPNSVALNPEAEKKKLEMLMRGRDMLQAHALAILAKQPKEYKQFKLESWEFEMLCDAYAETVASIGHIPPWINIVIAEAVIMIPKVVSVFDLRKKNQKLKEQKAEILALRAEKAALEKAVKSASRKDVATLWKVDENGYFMYLPNSQYLKADLRSEKPDLTPENYEQLVKYNGEEYIKKVFKLD